jgi:hypothetical protein
VIFKYYLKNLKQKPHCRSNSKIKIEESTCIFSNNRYIFVDRIYPTNLKRKGATDTARPATYIEAHTVNDSEGRLRRKIYDKIGYSKIPIFIFPFLCVNIPVKGHHLYSGTWWASIFSMFLSISACSLLLTIKGTSRLDYSKIPIFIFPFLCVNIPAAHVLLYGVHISPSIWYSRACDSYSDFLIVVRLKTSL